jgi:hypothetical protein
MMDWSAVLATDETLRWTGRPAPRCYTFRHWYHSLFGLLLFILSLYWLAIGIQLGAVYQLPWIPWIPIPFVLTGLYLSLGHLILARIEWEQVGYAVTDRRVLVRRGIRGQKLDTLTLDRLAWFQLRFHGSELGTLRLRGRDPEQRLTLCCLEHPRRVTALLEPAIARSGDACLTDNHERSPFSV